MHDFRLHGRDGMGWGRRERRVKGRECTGTMGRQREGKSEGRKGIRRRGSERRGKTGGAKG